MTHSRPDQPGHRAPVIGVTMGDPAGIGPEIVVKALADPAVQSQARFVIYGQNEALAYAADRAGIEPFWFRVPHDSERTRRPIFDRVVVFDHDECDGPPASTAPGPSRTGGFASKTFVENAIADALRPPGDPRHLDAVVTAPISKQSWALAGFDNWPGHTELFAYRTKAKRSGMAFISPRLRVALATVHLPLMEIRNVLTIGRVFDAIDLGNELCLELGIRQPRIAVCGLNPHAGEGGLFGDEEQRLITPAINVARQGGINVRGPFPADTVFAQAVSHQPGTRNPELGTSSPGTSSPRFDLVVAMYHDQGLIPIKLLDRDEAVNVTMGLPIVRTSPDHGTAFDIAGRNLAHPGSMKAAIRLAAHLARERLARAAAGQEPARSEPAA
ncbi:MAG: 4-hydroxythreonine-4-phosphate dehydrogenase PdxA [Phycisphaeraceae bacterium]|nr:4-hydroxythreonine-4-phosphate dehydrogenase PdxA [Phycisphaerales bacterium]QOJ18968.1 MAG: 4-hydroxythreonine-4-phosphate dehydrogenase PdxA [Phycisphaeraceae bacterium]